MSIAVDLDACILCDRCIRGCSEIRENFVLGRMGKGTNAGIAFDDNEPMGESSCVSCGECMVSCPTGALTNKGVTQTALGAGPAFESVSPDELQHLPVFKGVSGTFLSLNRGAVVKRTSAKAKSSAAKANTARPRSTFSKAKRRSPSPLRSRT